MYNILFIGSKWCDSYPPHGISNAVHMIVNSINASGLAKCKQFSYDEYYHKNKIPGDEAILKLCENDKFDFVVMNGFEATVEKTTKSDPERCIFSDISGVDLKPKGYQWLNPNLRTLTFLRQNMNLPIVAIWWDAVWKEKIELAEFLLDYVDFNIMPDSMLCLFVAKDPNRYLPLWAPEDPNLYYDIGEDKKDIPISFIGRLRKGRTGRKPRISYLTNHGIKVFHSGGQREKAHLSYEKYAEFIRRSKIGLNFPNSHSRMSQLTGRTFEITLSNSLLLEEMNLETARFFIPMADYVPFHGFNDLFLKAAYFMHHEDHRREIAQRGHEKASRYYNSKVFWQAVINKLKENGRLQ